MPTNQQVIQAFKRHFNSENNIIIASVISVDTDKYLARVEPLNGDADIDARIAPDVTGKTKFIPKIGSVVVVAMVSNTSGVIVSYSGVDEINLNGDNKGGLVIGADLLQKLNALEVDINKIKGIFATWIVAPNDGGAALKALSASWAADTLTKTLISDIENDTVKQGNGN